VAEYICQRDGGIPADWRNIMLSAGGLSPENISAFNISLAGTALSGILGMTLV
jgi:hypothetical protein